MKRQRTAKSKAAHRDSQQQVALRIPPLALTIGGIWLLLLAANPFFLVDRLPLIDLPDRSLIGSTSAWNPLLAEFVASNLTTDIPYWMGAIIIALLLGTAVHWAASMVHWSLLSAVVVGLASLTPRTTLLTLGCLWLAARLALYLRSQSRESNPRWPPLGDAALILLLSILSSLEFGLVAALLTMLVVVPAAAGVKRSTARVDLALALVLGWLVIVWLPSLAFQGYGPALVRPLSWLWLQPPTDLLPSMRPVWSTPEFGWPHLLALLLLVERWRQAIGGRVAWYEAVVLTLLSILALGCIRYLWLALAATLLATLPDSAASWATDESPSQAQPRAQLRGMHLAARATLCLGLLALGWQLVTQGATILASDVIRRTIDASQWNVSGPVMLTNLEQSDAWQHPRLKSQYQPILTDRWDAFHAYYDDYLAACDDWKNWKREAYVRSSGEWGGYQQAFDQWQPVLVAVDASDLAGIHRVSLDSQWKTIGIDHTRAVFALAASPATGPYVQFANQTLLTLEVPRPTMDSEFDRVVALGSPADACRVSAVLTSLRLPYAGLRVLPKRSNGETVTASMFAWSELAHRSERYAGDFSLLDCGRALGTPASLSGQSELVAQTRRYRDNLAALTNHRGMLQADEPTADADSAAEAAVRSLLTNGKLAEAAERAQALKTQEEVAFYSTLANVTAQSTEQLLGQFQQLLPQCRSPKLASECNFYIGCLAIEIGDVALAQNSLTASLQSNPDSAFAAIAEFYISQMGQ